MKNILIFLCLLCSSCTKQKIREIIYYSNCKDIEAEMELGRSIDLNKSKFEESNIGVVENLDSVFCGYRFINDNRTKEFMGVMTDIDLALEAEKFFAEETK